MGDAWGGVLIGSVNVGRRRVMSRGDRVRGIVTCARGITYGPHALLDLGVVGVRVHDRDIPLEADTEALAASGGSAVLLKPGTVLFFTVNQPVAMRLER